MTYDSCTCGSFLQHCKFLYENGYMCHQIILRWYAVNREMFSVFNEFAVIVVFGIIIILSYLLWHFIEKPCREKLGKLLRKPDKKGGQNYPQASPRSFAKLDSTPP